MTPGRKLPNNRAQVLGGGGGSDEVQPKAQVWPFFFEAFPKAEEKAPISKFKSNHNPNEN